MHVLTYQHFYRYNNSEKKKKNHLLLHFFLNETNLRGLLKKCECIFVLD